jgi:putative SOS response-associated peptidase YedK
MQAIIPKGQHSPGGATILAMCTQYTPATPSHLIALAERGGLGPVALPADEWTLQTFPGYAAPIVLRNPDGSAVCTLARFGLVPRWCHDAAQASKLSRRTYNARSETVAEKPSYRTPWRECRFALVPMMNYFEPCWESGRAVRWRLHRPDHAPFAVAALHELWTDPDSGEQVRSFSLLTVNADTHPMLRRMHRPGDEKRQLVVVPATDFGRWLNASVSQAHRLLLDFAGDDLTGESAAREAPPPGADQQSLLDF